MLSTLVVIVITATWTVMLSLSRTVYAEDGATTAERLLLDEIPRNDDSQAAAYFLGDSKLISALGSRELTAAERQLARMYGLPGITLAQQTDFVEYLVDYEGLFASDGDRTVVVSCLSYGAAVEQEYFPAALAVHGLWDYDEDEGLRPIPMTRLRARSIQSRARISQFIHARIHLSRAREVLSNCLQSLGLAQAPSKVRGAGRELRGKAWVELMGPNWQVEMPEQIRSLERLIDVVEEGGAELVFVVMPKASWEREQVFEASFREGLDAIIARRSIRLVDLSELLPDERYVDHSHYDEHGKEIVGGALMELAREHWVKTGLWPE